MSLHIGTGGIDFFSSADAADILIILEIKLSGIPNKYVVTIGTIGTSYQGEEAGRAALLLSADKRCRKMISLSSCL